MNSIQLFNLSLNLRLNTSQPNNVRLLYFIFLCIRTISKIKEKEVKTMNLRQLNNMDLENLTEREINEIIMENRDNRQYDYFTNSKKKKRIF